MTTITSSARTLTVDRAELTEALRSAGLLTDPKSRFSWRRDVVLGAGAGRLVVSSASDEATVTVAVDVLGDQRFGIALPHAPLRKSVEAFSCEVVGLRAISAHAAELTGGARAIKLDGAAPDPVRIPTSGKILTSFTVAGGAFTEALELVARCASGDQKRAMLNTVAIDIEDGHPVLVAGDTYRLAAIDLEGAAEDLDEPQLIPIVAARALAKDLRRRRPEAVRVDIGAEGTVIVHGDTVWTLRRAPGTYPRWRELLMVGGSQLTLDRRELEDALGAVRVLVGGGHEPVKLVLGAHNSLLYTNDHVGHMKEALPGSSWEGDPMDIGFSPMRLADAAAVIDDDELGALLSTPLRPVLFSRPGRRYLLMPSRLSETEPKRNGALSSNG